MKSTDNTTVETTTKKFELKLPAEFDIQPNWTVPVAKNWTARIYKIETPATDKGVATGLMSTYFHIIITHNISGKRWSYHEHGSHNELGVMLKLKDLAAELAPKVRITKVEQDDDQ